MSRMSECRLVGAIWYRATHVSAPLDCSDEINGYGKGLGIRFSLTGVSLASFAKGILI